MRVQTATHESLKDELRSVPYLAKRSLGEYLDYCRAHYPLLYERLDLSRFRGEYLERLIAELQSISCHFESESEGGRGDTYRNAQNRNPLFRAQGMQALLHLLQPDGSRFDPSKVVLDVLGGNGTFTRAIRSIQRVQDIPTVLTSDASPMMVADALEQGLPAVRQPAQLMLLRDNSIDGVLFAYGTHHIPPATRLHAFKEAYRVLKPHGRVVIQDFEADSPTARWYSELLDRYTRTGHKFEHFTRDGLCNLTQQAGFSNVQIIDVYDPFVTYGSDPEAARRQLVEHACSLFGLEKLTGPGNPSRERWKEIEEIIRPYGTFPTQKSISGVTVRSEPSISSTGESYVAEFPRVALVAVATKR